MPGFDAMRKFYVKAFAFLIGISLLFNISGTFADRVAPLDEWRIEHQQRLERLQARQDVIAAVTLGNSHSDSLDYSVLGIEGQSMAMGAADLFEIEKYALYLGDELPNLRTVFIAISYFAFRWDNATIEPYRTRRIRYYSVTPIWLPIRGDLPDYMFGKMESFTHMMSEVRSDNWLGVWEGLTSDLSTNTTGYDGVLTASAWGTCPHYTREQLESHALTTATAYISTADRMASVHPGLEQDAYKALARTVEGLQSRGIQVILFTPTYYEKYNDYFEQDGSRILEVRREMIERLRQTYQVEYYDFSHDVEIKGQPELFYNSDHLGECGKKVFTTKLLQAMSGNVQK